MTQSRWREVAYHWNRLRMIFIFSRLIPRTEMHTRSTKAISYGKDHFSIPISLFGAYTMIWVVNKGDRVSTGALSP
jgi:hypothetical protein